ncbi:hypothetical protein LOC67_23500 [Stieleria sp. JC731]|uniref:hypothetical protein n=1 Tax=Pirellulaceae TaxID=2691357 RepID=UPI001E2C0CF2|nr:hypothetical protein [Stieleria sp. JC731]MCC9603526.1 hypothetical protein [Stieleria sp. JC731]
MNTTAERPSIHTVSGNLLDLEHPDPLIISIGDIATALSNKCMFGGQLDQFYSVAEHSVSCAKLAAMHDLDRKGQLACLLYASTQAYISDHSLNSRADEFTNFETVVESAIEIRFGLNFELYRDCIQRIVAAVNRGECDELGRSRSDGTRFCPGIEFYSPPQARQLFLQHFAEIAL